MLYLRLDGSEEEKELFLALLPILRDIQRNKVHTMGIVDFSKVDLIAHCVEQYGAKEKNNPTNKRISRKKAQELRAKGLSYAKIASKLNQGGFKTSRGRFFHKMQVKRLLEEE